jgi:lysozyme
MNGGTLMSKLIDQLKRHEGLELKPYRCTAGKLTIGYGRNLYDRGITLDEAESLLVYDTHLATEDAMRYVDNDYAWEELNEARQAVIINMAFNLGLGRLSKFVRLKAALLEGDYERAAQSMEQSLWYKQVGRRSKELVKQMKTGEWE